MLFAKFYDIFIVVFYVKFNYKFMNSIAAILAKEKVVSLSALQKNPSKALDAPIVRIMKNGDEIGIFMSKEEFEDFLESQMDYRDDFVRELDEADRESRKEKLQSLDTIL